MRESLPPPVLYRLPGLSEVKLLMSGLTLEAGMCDKESLS